MAKSMIVKFKIAKIMMIPEDAMLLSVKMLKRSGLHAYFVVNVDEDGEYRDCDHAIRFDIRNTGVAFENDIEREGPMDIMGVFGTRKGMLIVFFRGPATEDEYVDYSQSLKETPAVDHDIDDMGVDDLRKEATRLKIVGRSTMKKQFLIAAIKATR